MVYRLSGRSLTSCQAAAWNDNRSIESDSGPVWFGGEITLPRSQTTAETTGLQFNKIPRPQPMSYLL